MILEYFVGHANCQRYWGIFWIDASSKENAHNDYGAIAKYFGKGDSFTAGFHWLSTRRQKWLLILDNADEPDEDLLDVRDLIPPTKHGHILVTTRNPKLPRDLANSGSLHLRDMKREEAIDLLLRCAYNDTDRQRHSPNRSVAGEIVTKMLYGLAKPINAAGRFIRKKEYTLERYLQLYLPLQKKHERLNQSMDPAEVAVETTWQTPMQHITQKAKKSTAHEDAVVLFHLFTFLHFNGIPQRVFHDLWRSADPITTSEQLPYILTSGHKDIESLQSRLVDAVDILHDYAIVETRNFDSSTDGINKSCYTFHPLVQASARNKLKHFGGTEDDRRPFWLKHALRFLASALPPAAEDLDPKLARRLIPHVVDCLHVVNEIDADRIRYEQGGDWEPPPSPTESDADSQHTHQMMLCNEEGASLYERLINVYDAVGWWHKSLHLYRIAMRLRRCISGTRSESTLQIERRFAFTCFLDYQLEEGIRTQLFLLIKQWTRRTSWKAWFTTPLVPDHLPFFVVLSDLSLSLWQAQKHSVSLTTGKLAAAGFAKRIERFRRLKKRPPDTLIAQSLTARFSVGRTLVHMGKSKEAHETLRAVVIECKRNLRLKHLQTVEDQQDLPLFKKRPPGLNHIDTLWARADLALALRDRKGYKLIVKSIMRNVMEGRRQILGEEHPYTLLGLLDYTKFLSIAGEPTKAVEIMRPFITVAERTLAHHGAARLHLAYGNMARVYAYAEQWDEAADTLVKFYQQIPPSSPSFFMVWAAFARLSFRAGRHEISERTLRILLARKAPRLKRGLNDATTSNILEQLAVLYKHTDQLDKLAGLKKEHPEIDESRALGSMYDVFNTQFPEDDDKIKMLYDIVMFMWKDSPKSRLGGTLFDLIRRYGEKRYGSEMEEDEAVERVRHEMEKEAALGAIVTQSDGSQNSSG